MSASTVIWEQKDGIGRITLNRPKTLNAWTAELGSELLGLLQGEAAAESVRAVLITGAGRGFSSGADLQAATESAEEQPDAGNELEDIYNPVISGVRRLPKPVVASVNGPAVGIGCSLALACDLVLAAESAFFGLAFVNVGLMPDGGSTACVPAAVGKARAFHMALLGERLSARDAVEWGLINQAYPDERLAEETEVLMRRLASGPTRAYASTKEALNNYLFGDLETQLRLESTLQRRLGDTRDCLEGTAAFVERREPHFTGT